MQFGRSKTLLYNKISCTSKSCKKNWDDTKTLRIYPMSYKLLQTKTPPRFSMSHKFLYYYAP